MNAQRRAAIVTWVVTAAVILTGVPPARAQGPTPGSVGGGADVAAAVPVATSVARADVVVVGAGTSGIAAAISARRAGAASVWLLDENDYLGGQVAAGVGTMDEGRADKFDQRQEGFWGDALRRFLDRYRSLGWPHASTCKGSATPGNSICIAPSIGRTVYRQMLQEARVTVRLGVRVQPRVRSGRITGVSYTKLGSSVIAGSVTTSVLIDATEYGDVLAATGAAYRSGNGRGNDPNSEPAGHIQDITWASVVRYYHPGTMPAALNLKGKPFPTPAGDKKPGSTKSRVLAAFAKKVAVGGSPYNNTTGRPWSPTWHLQYRGLPDLRRKPYLAKQTTKIVRTVLNYANDYPNETAGDLGGKGLPVAYLEDKAYRRKVNCHAKLRSIQFIWYMQNVLGQPNWSAANDEGFDTPYSRATRCSGTVVPTRYAAFEAAMPTAPYVRESRRGIGAVTTSLPDIRRTSTGAATTGPYGQTSPLAAASQPRDSVAVGYYVVDVHGPWDAANLELELETPQDHIWWDLNHSVPTYGPYAIPLRALVSSTVSGLVLAEKNISQSRFTNGATRLQPETTAIGAAAGTVAGLAAVARIAPSRVPPEWVQYRLARRGQFPGTNRFLDLARSDAALAAFELASASNIDPNETHAAADPEATVSRAAAVSWIRRAVGVPAGDRPLEGVADVDRSQAYARDAAALKDLGLSLACAPATFCPADPVTRRTFALWLAAASDAALGTTFTTDPDPTTGRFADVVGGVDSARIHALTTYLVRSHGVVVGSSFSPESPLLRRDAAQWTAWLRIDPALHPPAGR